MSITQQRAKEISVQLTTNTELVKRVNKENQILKQELKDFMIDNKVKKLDNVNGTHTIALNKRKRGHSMNKEFLVNTLHIVLTQRLAEQVNNLNKQQQLDLIDDLDVEEIVDRIYAIKSEDTGGDDVIYCGKRKHDVIDLTSEE